MMIINYILLLHLLGDFAAQTRWMANNKSKDFLPLLVHVLIYGLFLSVGLGWLVPIYQLLPFLIINVLLHMAIDAVTSRVSSLFWEKKWIYLFFLVVGFDQFLHATCLIQTAHYFLGVDG